MEAPKAVSDLVERFDAHRDAYKAPEYNETQVCQDTMVSFALRMLDLHKRVQAAKTEHERGVFRRQIAATDDEIDRLVYALYDLSEDEIAIVEESVKK